jgi:hypothetical protein
VAQNRLYTLTCLSPSTPCSRRQAPWEWLSNLPIVSDKTSNPFWQRHPRHHCIPNIARAQLHSKTVTILKAPRESDRKMKKRSKRTKERSGESTPDQTEAGFDILLLARLREVSWTQQSLNAFRKWSTNSDYSKLVQKRTFGQNTDCDLCSSRNLLRTSYTFIRTSYTFIRERPFKPDRRLAPLFTFHTSTFTFTGWSVYHPACACSLIRNILWEKEYIWTKSVSEVRFYPTADQFASTHLLQLLSIEQGDMTKCL